MKVAVVGCGNISANHFHALSGIKDAEIAAVVDIKRERAEAKASGTGAAVFTDFDEMLGAVKPDCVHIATPHYLHTPMAVKALESGANVFLEKPCSVSLDEINALINAQTKSGKQLGVCFQNRYNKCVRRAKEIIEGGSLGPVRAARAFVTWSRGGDYYGDDWHGTADKECGGVLINQSIHTVDLLLYLCGDCEALEAHVSNDHLKGVIEVEDTASVRMELDGGRIALLYATTAYSLNSEVMIELTFDDAVLRLEGERLYRISDGSYELLVDKQDKEFVGRDYWGHSHKLIIEDFYSCLRDGRPFSIDAREGGRAAKVVAASYLSSALNERVEVK